MADALRKELDVWHERRCIAISFGTSRVRNHGRRCNEYLREVAPDHSINKTVRGTDIAAKCGSGYWLR